MDSTAPEKKKRVLSEAQKANLAAGRAKMAEKRAAKKGPERARSVSPGVVKMPEKAYVAEHEELIKTLKEDKPEEVKKEAVKQEAELKKYKKGEMAARIQERLAKHGKKASGLGKMPKAQLEAVWAKVSEAYKD
jgi:hypothetical protein